MGQKMHGVVGGAAFAVAMASASSVVSCAQPEPPATGAVRQSDETAAPRFAYEDLVALVDDHGLTSLEQLLPLLPEDLRSSYVLMHDSRSLQSASAALPRVIMFGTDARLTCAFGGDSSQPSFDSLECFQFREASRTFDFRQIQFPTPANGLQHVAFSATNQSTDGRVQCTKCHGADPRPNWDGYDQWPGAYGTDDDTLKDDAAPYAAFVARRSTAARYRWLVQGAVATDPYMSDTQIGLQNRPNVRFSDACGRMNALRATRLLESRVPSWRSLAFAVKALKCALSPEQTAALARAGLDASHELDLGLGAIFDAVNVSSGDWGTQIFDDPSGTDDQRWEHQAGFTFLSVDIAMTVAQEQARAGNAALQHGLDQVAAYFTGRYTGPELHFFSALNELVPDPDMFGGHFPENTGAVCPALTDAFVAAAAQH